MNRIHWARLLLLFTVCVFAASGIVVLALGKGMEERPTARSTPAKTATPAPKPTHPCGSVDLSVPTPYAITGFWLQPSEGECSWYSDLQAIHRIGGDTVVRLGTNMEPRTAGSNGRLYEGDERDERFDDCQEGGKTCYQAAEAALKAANEKNEISRVYAYQTPESFGPGLARCPGFDEKVEFGPSVYFRVLVPISGSDSGCDFDQGEKFRLFIIKGEREDNVETLLNAADRFGIDVFTALPVATRDTKQDYRPDARYTGALQALTKRVLQDYQERHLGHRSLKGFYQSFEIQLRDWNKHVTPKVYAAQHKTVHDQIPGKPVLVSPFWDARRNKLGTRSHEVRKAVVDLAKSGADIIAPQDSRGTGKVPLYTPDRVEAQVEEALLPVSAVRKGSYRKNYFANTRDFYRAAAQAREEVEKDGGDVEIWANVEAFEPSGDNCGGTFTGGRGRTSKERLDKAIMMIGSYVSKLISYAWTSFYTCGSPSLSEQIADDHARPIVVEAFPKRREDRDGLAVFGYGLTRESTITLDANGEKTMVRAGEGWFDEEPWRTEPRLPRGLRMIWIPIEPHDGWIKIKATTGDLESTNSHVTRGPQASSKK